MTENLFAIIMAGGGGTRLWPLSRNAAPKQMLRLGREESLFQIAVQRLEPLLPPEQTLIVTGADQYDVLKAQCPQIPDENFILEPEPRDTANAIGLASVFLQKRDPEATAAVLTSDHFIKSEPEFLRLISAAAKAAQNGMLVTLGITPNQPSTAYGYIQQGEAQGIVNGYATYKVERFKEKPPLEEAEAMLDDGGYAWNSGMFIFRVEGILKEFEKQMPENYTAFKAIQAAIGTPGFEQAMQENWYPLKRQSIDYGIMENAEQVIVIPAARLGWDDVGSWSSLYEVLPGDHQGTVMQNGENLAHNSKNNLIYIDGEPRFVVTIGVENLVVVDTGDVLMICHKDHAQDVKTIQNKLKEKNLEKYL